MLKWFREWTKWIIAFVAGVFLALSAQVFADNQDNALPVNDIRTFAEVYGQIKANYYEDTKDPELIKDAISGMVSGLDPHSEYIPKEGMEDMTEITEGTFGGLGMEISKKDDWIVVVAPIEGTPADRAGIKSGDYIIKINDDSTRGMSTGEAVKKMRGKPGTSITLTLSRKDNPQPIVHNLKRDTIQTKSVRAQMIENDYGYVRLSSFQMRSLEDLVTAIQNLYQHNGNNLKGLILDLRNNPGGLLNQSVGISAAFLPPNVAVVGTKGRHDEQMNVLNATSKNYLIQRGSVNDPLKKLPAAVKEVPLVVLINSGSASASEIVSGALQDHRRAVIVGERSFGKGSVQTILPLSNGAAVKLTIALYYTPNERSIQAQGIVPDVEVDDPLNLVTSREADLSGHLNNPLGGQEVRGEVKPTTNAAAEKYDQLKDDDKRFEEMLRRRTPTPESDPQLKTALDLLKNPQTYQKSLGKASGEGRDRQKEN